MRLNNPAKRPEVIAKVIKALQGRPFRHRGGNGQLSVPQTILATRLNLPTEFVVLTSPIWTPEQKLPRHYKVDVAEPLLKLAIEVDGYSHNSPKGRARDLKKTSALTRLGWTVLRFSNKAVMENLEDCVQTVTSTISKLKEPTPTLPKES
jgi:hypothetical protein